MCTHLSLSLSFALSLSHPPAHHHLCYHSAHAFLTHWDALTACLLSGFCIPTSPSSREREKEEEEKKKESERVALSLPLSLSLSLYIAHCITHIQKKQSDSHSLTSELINQITELPGCWFSFSCSLSLSLVPSKHAAREWQWKRQEKKARRRGDSFDCLGVFLF